MANLSGETKTDIYEKHQAAFKDVSAYIVTDHQNKLVARVAFKRGTAITCYFHLIGLAMTKGIAGGGGYDRNSAAAYSAIEKTKVLDGACPGVARLLPVFKTAIAKGNDGSHWDYALREAGFNVLQAV